MRACPTAGWHMHCDSDSAVCFGRVAMHIQLTDKGQPCCALTVTLCHATVSHSLFVGLAPLARLNRTIPNFQVQFWDGGPTTAATVMQWRTLLRMSRVQRGSRAGAHVWAAVCPARGRHEGLP